MPMHFSITRLIVSLYTTFITEILLPTAYSWGWDMMIRRWVMVLQILILNILGGNCYLLSSSYIRGLFMCKKLLFPDIGTSGLTCHVGSRTFGQSEVLIAVEQIFPLRISLYFASFRFLSTLNVLPVPAAKNHPHSMMPLPPCFTVGMVLGRWWAVPGFLELRPNSPIIT